MKRREFVGGSLAAISLAGMPQTTAVAASAEESPPRRDRLEIQVGPALVRPMFSRWKDTPSKTIPMLAAIPLLRQQLGDESIFMPLVRLRDNQHLEPNAWQILVDGEVVDEGSVASSQKLNLMNHLPILGRLTSVVREHQERLLGA